MWQDARFDYDAWGNVAVKRKGAHQVQVFTFDAENRLMKVVTKNSRGHVEATFEYDALGRRIGKTETTTEANSPHAHRESVRFVWQGLRMVQEVDPDYVRSYVYSPDAAWTPLARVDVANLDEVPDAFRTLAMTRPRVLHFHTDQIGTPQEVTGQDGTLLWSGRYDAWGRVRKGDVTARIEQPLRFAGQYADGSTGLHYNTFRYYDPDVGRFVSQDPIGLRGGLNLYAYAPNATSWTDPLGWAGDPANATHITYVGVKDGKPYVGYASKPGFDQPPDEVLKYRYPNTEHFDVEPKPIYSGNGQDGKDVARGLEQRIFEQKGGLSGTSNRQNPVGMNNASRERYLAAADKHLAAQEGSHSRGTAC